jgi:phosphatidylglycerophosphate synthase
MRKVHQALVVGLLAQVVLLSALVATVGLTLAGWSVGLACGVVACALLRRGLSRSGAQTLGQANGVTLSRTVLVGGIAGLVVGGSTRSETVAALVVLSSVALVLDGVDGWVARRTRSTTPVGARFDMEVDAFLILVLSVHVAETLGAWVLVIGAARYAFVVSGWVLPWMCATLPFRYWRKVVAAVQGIVLTLATASIFPSPVVVLALLVAMALLAESFGRDVWWLWSRAQEAHDLIAPSAAEIPAAATTRQVF